MVSGMYTSVMDVVNTWVCVSTILRYRGNVLNKDHVLRFQLFNVAGIIKLPIFCGGSKNANMVMLSCFPGKECIAWVLTTMTTDVKHLIMQSCLYFFPCNEVYWQISTSKWCMWVYSCCPSASLTSWSWVRKFICGTIWRPIWNVWNVGKTTVDTLMFGRCIFSMNKNQMVLRWRSFFVYNLFELVCWLIIMIWTCTSVHTQMPHRNRIFTYTLHEWLRFSR